MKEKLLETLKLWLKRCRFSLHAAGAVLSQSTDEAFMSGDVTLALTCLHYALLEQETKVTLALVKNGHELFSLSDFQFCTGAFRSLREEFSYMPQLTPEQFLTRGFGEKKMSLLIDVLKLVHERAGEINRAETSRKTKVVVMKTENTCVVTKHTTAQPDKVGGGGQHTTPVNAKREVQRDITKQHMNQHSSSESHRWTLQRQRQQEQEQPAGTDPFRERLQSQKKSHQPMQGQFHHKPSPIALMAGTRQEHLQQVQPRHFHPLAQQLAPQLQQKSQVLHAQKRGEVKQEDTPKVAVARQVWGTPQPLPRQLCHMQELPPAPAPAPPPASSADNKASLNDEAIEHILKMVGHLIDKVDHMEHHMLARLSLLETRVSALEHKCR